eukprot:PLAT11856.1.p2 GENE.PLAT11856.1~~PLAT11856.1.p2  ORF type:complete len:355 (+),score=184.08 PLAT11856.1:38-1102(+)
MLRLTARRVLTPHAASAARLLPATSGLHSGSVLSAAPVEKAEPKREETAEEVVSLLAPGKGSGQTIGAVAAAEVDQEPLLKQLGLTWPRAAMFAFLASFPIVQNGLYHIGEETVMVGAWAMTIWLGYTQAGKSVGGSIRESRSEMLAEQSAAEDGIIDALKFEKRAHESTFGVLQDLSEIRDEDLRVIALQQAASDAALKGDVRTMVTHALDEVVAADSVIRENLRNKAVRDIHDRVFHALTEGDSAADFQRRAFDSALAQLSGKGGKDAGFLPQLYADTAAAVKAEVEALQTKEVDVTDEQVETVIAQIKTSYKREAGALGDADAEFPEADFRADFPRRVAFGSYAKDLLPAP